MNYEINVNGDVLCSKSMRMTVNRTNPTDIIRECTDEVLKGLKLNKADIWAYVVALETLSETLKNIMNDDHKELYQEVKNAITTVSFVNRKKRGEGE